MAARYTRCCCRPAPPPLGPSPTTGRAARMSAAHPKPRDLAFIFTQRTAAVLGKC